MDTNPDANRVTNDSPANTSDRTRCNITLPSWPTDRQCMLGPGHEGDHSDGRATWTTDRAMTLAQCILEGARDIVANAERLARESVLRGTVSMQVKGAGNRAARRRDERIAKRKR